MGLHVGDSIVVTAGSDDTPTTARIVAIDAKVDPTTRNAMVRARVKGDVLTAGPGASVRVLVPVGGATEAVAVPVSALRKGPDGDHVFVIAADAHGKDRAHLRLVQAGEVLGDEVLILQGVKAGERVAASGAFKLRKACCWRWRATRPPRGREASDVEQPSSRDHRSLHRHPVIAAVVNLAIVLVGWRALASLPIQQYPKVESSSVVITTVYYGASAETVRGFLTTPVERAVSAIGGVEHIESTSRAGVSTVTIRLKLNYSSTAALAEVTARLQQVRSELPPAAEPPTVDIQRTDRPYASFYLGFTSTERSVPEVTDWLSRSLQPQLATVEGVQRVEVLGRPIAMRVWIEPDRLAAVNLAPGDVYAALQRNNYLAAVGQTKGNQVQVDLLANTDLKTPEEFANLIVADRGGAVVRLRDVARTELGAEEAQLVAKYNTQEAVYLGVWPLPGANEIEVGDKLVAEMNRIRPTLPRTSRCGWCGTAPSSCATRSTRSARPSAKRC